MSKYISIPQVVEDSINLNILKDEKGNAEESPGACVKRAFEKAGWLK